MPEENLSLESAKYTVSWNLRDNWNGNGGPLLLRRCFIENVPTYLSLEREQKRRPDAQQEHRLFSVS